MIPDLRDIEGIDELIDELTELRNKERKISRLNLGYVCATAICIVMLYFDGAVAVATAAGVAGTMAGLTHLAKT